MLSRRSVLAGSAALFTAPGRAEPRPLRFGVIADPQYADAPPNTAMGRYYAESLGKLAAAVEVLNAQDLRFVVTLGDVIDRDFASFDRILPIYRTLRHETRFVLGNHDFEVGAQDLDRVVGRLGMTGPYYDFAVLGLRFVVLDGNDVSLFAPPQGDPRWQLAQDRLARAKAADLPNAKPWNGSFGPAQVAWLERTLSAAQAAGERVVVLNHYPVLPENPHNQWDSGEVVALLARFPNVVAYFNGHNHAGNYGQAHGIHFVNFRGMVDTPDTSAFAVVEILTDRIDIRGYGREPSRSLPLRAV